jgi:hypothetical protein
MASHYLPSIVTKIIAFYLHVTIHIRWSQMMNLYLLTFFSSNTICHVQLISHVICPKQLMRFWLQMLLTIKI